MWTRRRGAVRARGEHLGRANPAVAAPGYRPRPDALTRQGEGQVGRAPVREAGDTVAVETDALDLNDLRNALDRLRGLSRTR